MTISVSSSSKPSLPVLLLGLLSLIGFADATYLTIKHYTGGSLPCSLGNGCDIVTTSSYSMIGGVPVSLLGAIYYLAMFVLLLTFLDSRNPRLLTWVSRLTGLGFLVSLYFVYLQAFVLRNFCEYCLISATTTTLLFIISTIIVWPRKL